MRRVLLPLVAFALGVGAAEYLATSFPFRHWLGQVAGRGNLEVLVGGAGIYDTDAERARAAKLFATGADAQEIEEAVALEQKRVALEGLIRLAKLDEVAARQAIDPGRLGQAMDLLRWQFQDEKTWRQALRRAGLTARALQNEIAAHLRGEAWLEGRVAPQLLPNDAEARRYFDEHRALFQEPLRLRASHLFLAAPVGYPAEVIEQKQKLIAELAQRLTKGEPFDPLVSEFSEDEATKKRAGDLGYFAEERMLPAVFAAARQLQPGQISAPVRSRLGFHILRLMDSQPARLLNLEEARVEIETALANQKRAAAVAAKVAALR